MLTVRYSTRFRRDFKVCVKRRYDMELLQRAIDLTGDYAGHRECHLSPDWLLIYKQSGEELLLYRTGTHSDLFR